MVPDGAMERDCDLAVTATVTVTVTLDGPRTTDLRCAIQSKINIGYAVAAAGGNGQSTYLESYVVAVFRVP